MWNRQQVLRVSLSLAALCLASGFPVLSMADSPQPVSSLNHQYQHFSFGGLAGLTSAYTHTNNGIFNATHTLAEPSPLLTIKNYPHKEQEASRLELPEQDTGNLGLTASVCFITDAGNCSGAGTGSDLGGSSSSGPGPIEPDNEERCRLEGYTNQKCGTGQTTGSKCPYDGNWHSGCTCNPEYNKTCTGANEQGKGTACDGKYKECCNPCNGYDYTASNIPAGYVKNGSCTGCNGTKYKIKCDTNTSNTGTYVDCGTAGGTGGTCTDDTGTYYKECTCPNMYEWSASSKKCVCSTGYKYTCSGTNDAGGEGAACDNKYQKCKCKTGFTWSASSGMCTCSGTDWCTLNQDCSSLGYKQQSCPEMAIKCPFNTNYVYCVSCPSNYKSCSGEGMVGSGATCGGKYTTCTCAEGYSMVDGACVDPCKDSCGIGCLYYSDNTCSTGLNTSKTLLGVVIYEKSASQNGWVMTHKPVATNIVWSTKYVNISGLTDYSSTPTDLQASCTNTDKITAQGDSSKYPAAWAAKNYKEGGKTWCLPSGRLLQSAKVSKFNAAILEIQSKAGTSAATILGNVYNGSEGVWSSSEYSYRHAWVFFPRWKINRDSKDYINRSYSVRPVFAF